MKPPFRYYGGKGRLAPWIVSMLPEHTSYIEPFFGAGAVLFNKAPSRHEIINDLDDQVVNFYRVLRDHPQELVSMLEFTAYARSEFNDCKRNYDDTEAHPIEQARRFFTVVSQSFACTTGTASGWSASTSKNINRARSTHHYIARLTDVAARLRHVMIESKPAVDVITSKLVRPESLLYCDPPSVHEARGNDSNTGGHGYRHEMTDDDHRELAEALNATKATVLLSGYPSDLYSELYKHWHSVEYATYSTVAGITDKDVNTARTEVVWSNRPINDGRLPL